MLKGEGGGGTVRLVVVYGPFPELVSGSWRRKDSQAALV